MPDEGNRAKIEELCIDRSFRIVTRRRALGRFTPVFHIIPDGAPLTGATQRLRSVFASRR